MAGLVDESLTVTVLGVGAGVAAAVAATKVHVSEESMNPAGPYMTNISLASI